MRDSQSLLDQAVSYSGMEIRNEDLQAILGAVAQETLKIFADGLLARDASGLLRLIDTLLEQGQDMRQFLAGAVEHIRNLIITRIAKDAGPIIELPAADLETIKQQASSTDTERLVMLFDSLSRTLEEMRWSPHQRFTLEVGLVKACSVATLKPLGEVLDRMKSLEAQIGARGQGHVVKPEAVRERTAGYASSARNTASAQTTATGNAPVPGDPWGTILTMLKQKKASLASVLGHSKALNSTADSLVIGIKGSSFQLELAEQKESRDLVEQLAAEVLGRRVQVKYQLLVEEKKVPPKGTSSNKPAPEEQDPFLQDTLSIFNGQVIEADGAD
jgi:DNA polymerase-3 subunit gamma/tau